MDSSVLHLQRNSQRKGNAGNKVFQTLTVDRPANKFPYFMENVCLMLSSQELLA